MAARRRNSTRELAEAFSFRLFADQRQKYEEQAAQGSTSLTNYLRERLDGEDQLLDVLDGVIEGLEAVNRRLADIEDNLNKSSGGGAGLNYEILLLLRLLMRNNGGEQNIKMIQADIKQLGYEPFEIVKGEKR